MINYDSRNDILYIKFKPTDNSYGTENNNIVTLRDLDTDEITGYTVFGRRNDK